MSEDQSEVERYPDLYRLTEFCKELRRNLEIYFRLYKRPMRFPDLTRGRNRIIRDLCPTYRDLAYFLNDEGYMTVIITPANNFYVFPVKYSENLTEDELVMETLEIEEIDKLKRSQTRRKKREAEKWESQIS